MSDSVVTAVQGKLRLILGQRPLPGNISGFWWPRSRSFQNESSQLVEDFPPEFGRVVRLLYSDPDWDYEPNLPKARWLKTRDTRIKVGSFPGDNTSLMILRTDLDRRFVLMVIPSGMSRQTASKRVSEAMAGSVLFGGNALGGADPLAGWADD